MSNDIVSAAGSGLPKSTRRNLMAGATALAVASAAPAALADAPDPVFGAIDRLRAATAALHAFPPRHTIEDEHATETEYDAVSDTDLAAWRALCTTVPTTHAGVVALIAAIVAYPHGVEVDELLEALDGIDRFFASATNLGAQS